MSVLAQSYNNWRILLRDDLSTDKTATVINDFVKQQDLSEKIQLTVNIEKHGEVAEYT